MLALPLGVEPRSSVPETNVLSIELQEQCVFYRVKVLKSNSLKNPLLDREIIKAKSDSFRNQSDEP